MPALFTLYLYPVPQLKLLALLELLVHLPSVGVQQSTRLFPAAMFFAVPGLLQSVGFAGNDSILLFSV
jgi:hypothetical protein